ncbi:MAG: Gfo/Idh/MocA family oxidoreductase [Blautia sp.]|nr:Gfo/Idh/MocA family oxidoreductase [Blautia sp.]MCM1282631.1 Gfo/Idh/MocA family oxidoreductase [Roseburia sp.]MCM1431226.1 Gfo/Idh/MocA family oxidoreductase [Muribaculaceae bacterium]MCM1492288.1 Gfo/Idh/MocA family oxidoreductase [Muribaculaceae bacterium]
MIRAGIVGFGYMGHFHLRKIKEIDGIQCYAAFDVDGAKSEEAEKEGLKIYPSLKEMLEDILIDLIVICTPNDSHAQIAVAALRQGKHVLCEKPATMSVKELEAVLECANAHGKIFTTHQNRRWDTDYRVCRNVVDSGNIGQVTTIVSQTFGQRGVCFGWRAEASRGGGMLYDWGIHLIDQILLMFPEKKVIGVYARLRSILTPVVDDYFEIELELEGDIVAHISVGTFALQSRPRWYVFGDRGTLRIDDFSGKTGGAARIKTTVKGFERIKKEGSIGPSRTMAHLEPDMLEHIPLPEEPEEPYAFYMNLIAAIEGKDDPYVSHVQMMRDMEVIEKVFESAGKHEYIRTAI